MARAHLQYKQFLFTPADYTADEVRPVWTAPLGTYICGANVRILTGFDGTGAETELGITDVDDDGLIATASVTEADAGLYKGAGDLIDDENPGYLVTAAAGAVVAIKFVAGTTGTVGQALFTVYYFRAGE